MTSILTRFRDCGGMVLTGPIIRTSQYTNVPGYSWNPNIITATWSPDCGLVGETKSMADNTRKNFRKLISSGAIVMSDMELHKVSKSAGQTQVFDTGTIVFPANSVHAGQPHSHHALTGDLGGLVLNSRNSINWTGDVDFDIQRMRELAIVKAYSRVTSAPIMGGEVLRDLERSVAMLRRPFKTSLDIIQRMLKNRQKRLGKTVHSALKATQHAWLEGRYGLQPVLIDCDTAIDQVHVHVKNMAKGTRLVARAGERCQSKETGTFTKTGLGTWTGLVVNGSTTRTCTSSANAGVMYTIKNRTPFEEIVAVLGLRPRDLPATLWEFMPWSFVADWFTNIGTWIEAITPDPDVEILGNWVTTVDKRTEIDSGISFDWPYDFGYGPVHVFRTGFSGASITTEHVSRRCNQLVAATPTLTYKPLSKLHAADALALLLDPLTKGLRSLRH